MGLMETASRIIKRFGQAGEIVRPGEGFQSDWGWQPGQPTLHPCHVAILDYTQEERANTAIEASDLRALVSVEGLDIAPNTGDTLRVGGHDYALVQVMPLAPDGVARFFDLQVRA